jgi:CRP-like cAMP-binding protein
MSTQVLSGRERFFAPFPAPRANPTSSENPALVSASAIFAGLSHRELSEIVSRARVRTFVRNELLFSQGQSARSLIVLQSGCVKHTQLSSNGDEVLLRLTATGEAVNLQTGPIDCNHTCSARAMEECRAWVWEYNRLQQMLDDYPRLRANLTRALASRLQELEERFREVATEKVARRLALVLLRLVKQLGRSTPEGALVSLSREEMAQMTGTTLFTISRILSRWAEEGLVAPKREAVVILDPRGLESVSEVMC